MGIRNRIHRFYFSTASGVLSISVQASLSWIIILTNKPCGRTSTLWISKRFVTIASIWGITLHAIVIHCANFNNGWTLLQLHYGSFFPRLMVWIKWTVSFNAIQFDWIVTPSPLVIVSVRIIYRSSLTCYTHYLRLVSSGFQIRVNLHLLSFLTSLVLGILVYLQVGRWVSISWIKVFFLVTSRAFVRLRVCVMILQPWFWFTASFDGWMLNCTHVILISIFHVCQLRKQRTAVIASKCWTWKHFRRSVLRFWQTLSQREKVLAQTYCLKQCLVLLVERVW